MANDVVVDTDVFIDFLRNLAPGASLFRKLDQGWRILFTSVTAYELRGGSDEPDDLLRQMEGRTLPLDLDGALISGQIGRELRRQGASIGIADTLIAGTCLRHGLPLATRNRKHFERVPGLELVDL